MRYSRTIRGKIKCDKDDAQSVIDKYEEIDGVSATQRTTDEFDIPPTAVIEVQVDLKALRDD